MNILYLHGWGSRFNPNVPKIEALAEIGNVFGPDINYAQDPSNLFDKDLMPEVFQREYELVIGTSMGGWYASQLAPMLNIPFIALNPVLEPDITLGKSVGLGPGTDFSGRKYILRGVDLDSYRLMPFCTDGVGEVVLELGDELLDSADHYERLTLMNSPNLDVYLFPGGSHRFDSINTVILQSKFMREDGDSNLSPVPGGAI